MSLHRLYKEMEDIDHHIGEELPPPASKILVQCQYVISLFITQIPFDTM